MRYENTLTQDLKIFIKRHLNMHESPIPTRSNRQQIPKKNDKAEELDNTNLKTVAD
tara:strand:+ start:1559 stop:1726 length:168 start_codon:yes stop_codon:yes gene_type:complete